jgi:hypothetical protein
VFPIVAPLKEKPLYLFIHAFIYTIYWNFLDMPSGTIPQGLVCIENNDELFYKDSFNNGDIIETETRKAMKGSEGMPLGV